MVVTDPIADMLTRIRNANQLKYKEVLVPTSKLKVGIADILKNEGYINGLKRISKPGLRVYAKKEEVPTVLNGLGIAIISTSKGLMVDREARKENLGGEVLAYIW